MILQEQCSITHVIQNTKERWWNKTGKPLLCFRWDHSSKTNEKFVFITKESFSNTLGDHERFFYIIHCSLDDSVRKTYLFHVSQS